MESMCYKYICHAKKSFQLLHIWLALAQSPWYRNVGNIPRGEFRRSPHMQD